jgi:hypothetical protein
MADVVTADPSILLQQQTPDFLGSYQKGVKLSDMATDAKMKKQQWADDQTTRQAFQDNMLQPGNDPETGKPITDPTTGQPITQPTLDRKGVLSDLNSAGLGQKAYDMQRTWNMQDLQQHQTQVQNAMKNNEAEAQLLGGVTDQPSYEAAVATANKLGLVQPGQLPKQYDPDLVKSIQMGNMSMKDKLSAQNEAALTAIKATQAQTEKRSVDVKEQDLALQRAKLYGGSGQPTVGQGGQVDPSTDPATLVPSRVPQAHQAKAFAEIDAAQNTAKNAPQILKAFDDAANNIHGVDFVPGMANKDQKALHALMGPTFKDVEGTVRQAAMDNMNNNTTPQYGDSQKTIDTKRAALVGYLKSKSSSPTNKGYGIDLGNFKSTAITDKALSGSDQSSGPMSFEDFMKSRSK